MFGDLLRLLGEERQGVRGLFTPDRVTGGDRCEGAVNQTRQQLIRRPISAENQRVENGRSAAPPRRTATLQMGGVSGPQRRIQAAGNPMPGTS